MTSTLGSILKVYRGLPLRWCKAIIQYVPAIGAVFAPLFYGLQRFQFGHAQYGMAAAIAWSRPWFLLAAFATLPLLFLTLRRLLRAHSTVSIHEHGLRLRFPPFFERELRWGQIAGIACGEVQMRFLAFSLHSYHSTTLYPTLGKPISLDGRIENLADFSREVQGHIFPRLLPAMQKEFNEGRWLYFGSLAVQRRGMTFTQNNAEQQFRSLHLGRRDKPTGKNIPWEQVKSLALRDGYLMVELDRGRPRRVPVASVPNLELFYHLIERDLTPDWKE
jgi:hypothetical protein